MENIIKIAKYSKIEDNFIKDGYDEFKITYLKGTKAHELRIVINNSLSKRTINIINLNESYRNKILLAIKDYKEDNLINKNVKVTKNVNINKLKAIYNKKIIHNIEHHLLTINKEESRDKLTEYNLI
jgi:hypothetical protein